MPAVAAVPVVGRVVGAQLHQFAPALPKPVAARAADTDKSLSAKAVAEAQGRYKRGESIAYVVSMTSDMAKTPATSATLHLRRDDSASRQAS